jgi:A/G-specific adenine glycosylase
MLQQTRVDTVLPYFHRFLKEVPDVVSLAAMEEDRLFKLWEGLGYYNRCKNMHLAAKRMVESYQGTLPDTYEALLDLPGVGPYTAGAIASICYGQRVVAVDGNVLRVIARVFGMEEDIGLGATGKTITQKVREMMPEEDPGEFNQGLMELGATVCLPSGSPLCARCPWVGDCISYKQGWIQRIPVKEKQKPRRVEQRTVLVLVCGNLVALAKRPDRGLLSGLWEFPNEKGTLSIEEATLWATRRSIDVVRVAPLGSAKHIFSHVEWQMIGYQMETSVPSTGEPWQWVTLEDVQHRFAIPTAFEFYRNTLGSSQADVNERGE